MNKFSFVLGAVLGSIVPLVVDIYKLQKECKTLESKLNMTTSRLERAEKELERRPPYQSRFGTPRNGANLPRTKPDFPIGFC